VHGGGTNVRDAAPLVCDFVPPSDVHFKESHNYTVSQKGSPTSTIVIEEELSDFNNFWYEYS